MRRAGVGELAAELERRLLAVQELRERVRELVERGLAAGRLVGAHARSGSTAGAAGPRAAGTTRRAGTACDQSMSVLGVPLPLLAALVEGAQLLDLAAVLPGPVQVERHVDVELAAQRRRCCASSTTRRPRSRRASGGTPRESSPSAPLLVVLVRARRGATRPEAERARGPRACAGAPRSASKTVLAQHLVAELARREGEDGQPDQRWQQCAERCAARKRPALMPSRSSAPTPPMMRCDRVAAPRCSSGRSPGELVVLEERAQQQARVGRVARRAGRRARRASARAARPGRRRAASARIEPLPRCGRGCAPPPRRRAAPCCGSGGRATTCRARRPRRPRAGRCRRSRAREQRLGGVEDLVAGALLARIAASASHEPDRPIGRLEYSDRSGACQPRMAVRTMRVARASSTCQLRVRRSPIRSGDRKETTRR